MEVDEGSDQKSDILPHWMAVHACLKKEITEDKKNHNLMRWLVCVCDSDFCMFSEIQTAWNRNRDN